MSTLTVLIGTQAQLNAVLTTVSALSLLVFCLLYTPCLATIATVRHEMGSRYALLLVLWQCFVAWVCAFCVYHVVLMI